MSHRILVAGASGTIGSALVAELLRQGADVTALRSKPSSEASPVPVVVGDFARPDTLAEAMRGFDTLFLLLPLAPAAHSGRTYDLTGPEALTEAEQMALISQELGRPVQYVDVPLDTARDAMAASGMPPAVVDWLTSLNAIVRNGWGAGLADGVQTLTGRPPRRFADFVRDHIDVWG